MCYRLPRDPADESTYPRATDKGLDLWEASEQILWYIFLATETFVFYIQFLWNSIPSTGWLFLPNLVAAQLWNSPSLLSKNYSWLLPQQQIFWKSQYWVWESVTFHLGTQYDWINNEGVTYKSTTHQNIIMHYIEFIFLNCTDVMPPTLPLIFWCLNNFQFPFTWWWKIDLLMSSCITHLSFYLLKKTAGILINYRFDCNSSHMFLHVHNHQTWTQIVTLPTVPHKS